jgi:cell fate (sporulation/competence/biofilm development) regulator YlbF (YheA/YmcA/DUF963 family)
MSILFLSNLFKNRLFLFNNNSSKKKSSFRKSQEDFKKKKRSKEEIDVEEEVKERENGIMCEIES